jgi:branched-chain amino acid transport system permease protein
VLGTLLAVIFGIAVRTRGVYFILVTIALGFIVWGVTYRWASFTGGDNGITNVPYPAVGEWRVASMTAYYYVVLVIVALYALAYRRLVSSPFGLTLRGIKSSESRMRSLGFDPIRHLYIAFVLSGFMASSAGVLYIYFNRFVNPATAHFHISVEAVLMTIIGGTGTIVGPFLGSAIILSLRNWISGFVPYYMTIMGLVFIVTVLFAPKGIVGLFNSWRRRLTRYRAREAGAPAVEADAEPRG